MTGMTWAWAITWGLVGAVGGVVLWMVLWVVILNLKDIELIVAAELAELRRKAERLAAIEHAGMPAADRMLPPLPMEHDVTPAAPAPTPGSRAVQAEQDRERERRRPVLDEPIEGTKPLPPGEGDGT